MALDQNPKARIFPPENNNFDPNKKKNQVR